MSGVFETGRPEHDHGLELHADEAERDFFTQLTLTDGRLAVLLTEYEELGERISACARTHDGDGPGTPPRSNSLAHYHSRQVENLDGRRAEIRQTLKNEGMPTEHWVGYGNRAALLAESPPGYPERLELYDCLWKSLEQAADDATPLQIVRASRRLEFRNSLPGPRRALLALFEAAQRSSSVVAIELLSVIMLIILTCTLASHLFAPSAGVLIALILVIGFGGICAVDGLNAGCRRQHEYMQAELARRERARIPEPSEQVYVRGRPAEVEYAEPGEKSPVGEGRLDVRFAADGSRGRVALGDVKPAVTGHTPESYGGSGGGFKYHALQSGRGDAPSPWIMK